MVVFDDNLMMKSIGPSLLVPFKSALFSSQSFMIFSFVIDLNFSGVFAFSLK